MATNYTHTVGKTYKTDSGTLASPTQTFTADSEVNYKGAIPANTTNGEIDLAITVANVRSMMLYSDQDVTIKTNSSTTPQETISLKAKIMLQWDTTHTETIPYAGNVTKFYVTTGSIATAANLVVTHLVDQTPSLGDPA